MTAALWFASGAVIALAWMILSALVLAGCARLLERWLDRVETREAAMANGPCRPACAPSRQILSPWRLTSGKWRQGCPCPYAGGLTRGGALPWRRHQLQRSIRPWPSGQTETR